MPARRNPRAQASSASRGLTGSLSCWSAWPTCWSKPTGRGSNSPGFQVHQVRFESPGRGRRAAACRSSTRDAAWSVNGVLAEDIAVQLDTDRVAGAVLQLVEEALSVRQGSRPGTRRAPALRVAWRERVALGARLQRVSTFHEAFHRTNSLLRRPIRARGHRRSSTEPPKIVGGVGRRQRVRLIDEQHAADRWYGEADCRLHLVERNRSARRAHRHRGPAEGAGTPVGRGCPRSWPLRDLYRLREDPLSTVAASALFQLSPSRPVSRRA